MAVSRNRIFEIIEAELEVDPGTVSLDVDLENLGVTSPDLLEIALAIEEEFGMEIPDKDLSGFQKVDDIVAYVEEREDA